MSKVKIGFSNLNVPDQIERSRSIQTGMTGNVNYTTPIPSLPTLKTATDALETAWNESRNRDKVKIQIMKILRTDMLALITQLAAYVQSASDGDKAIILSSGFSVIERGAPQPPVGQVLNVRAFKGTVSGSIKLLWDKMPGARIYALGVSVDPFTEQSFEIKAVSTKTRYQIDTLKPGTKYWIRIMAVGKDGPGIWSDPASKIAE